MASKDLINIAMQLAKQLGANTNKFMGTRTNISFLGKGPQDDLLFQQDINTEALSVLPLSKILPQIESSMGYLTGGKLNDLQATKLVSNLHKMKEFHFPSQIPNITDMGTGTRNLTQEGLGALRDKTGATPLTMPFLRGPEGVRPPGRAVVTDSKGNPIQDTEWANRLAKAEGVAPEETILPTKDIRRVIDEKEGDDFIDFIRSQGDEAGANKIQAEVDRLNAAIAAADARVAGKSSAEIDALETMTKNKAGTEFITAYVDDVYKNSGVTASVDVPKKRAAAREFLYNILKKETDLIPPGSGGTLESVISDADYKYIMEGGGGALGDPLILVKKYFGDTIAKRIPLDTRTEVIDTFVENVRFAKDRAGFTTDDPRFNPDDIPDFAAGGRVGFMAGGIGKFTKAEVLIARLKNTIKDSKGKTDELSVYVNETFPGFIKEIKANPKLAENENVWKTLGLDLPKDQRLVVHSDDTVDFFRQTEFGPHNIKNVEKFMAEHPFLSREDALRILKMEPEDRVLEITRLQVLNNRTKNAHGGLAKILEV